MIYQTSPFGVFTIVNIKHDVSNTYKVYIKNLNQAYTVYTIFISF